MSPDPPAGLEARVRVPRAGFAVDVALAAPPGITLLFGASGAGKSTILGAIAGIVRPEAGRIALGDEVWFDAARGTWAPVHARKVAYVFQSLALFPHMSALENVEYGVARALPAAERRARAGASLEKFRASHIADRRPGTFSGGEAQRVALARAFAMQPRVVLLDEPFSAMDRALRREFAADVRRIADDLRVPVLLVTHHRAEARAMAARALVIERGHVVREGSVDDVLPDDD